MKPNQMRPEMPCDECLKLWDLCFRLMYSESRARREEERWRKLCYWIAGISSAAVLLLTTLAGRR